MILPISILHLCHFELREDSAGPRLDCILVILSQGLLFTQSLVVE